MGLFDPVRGVLGGSDDEPDEEAAPDPVLPPEYREPTPTEFRNKAVDAVQDWDELELDFSLESLERLDQFARREGARLDLLRDEEGDEAASHAHTAYTVQAGSYFGEVLARRLDGEWTKRGERWSIVLPGADGDAAAVDVFEVAAHSFAEQPAFAEFVREAGVEIGDDEDEEDADDDDPEAGVEMGPEAESFAHSWEGYDLDFTASSLVRLSELVAAEWDGDRFRNVTVGGDDMDSKMYTKLVKQVGAYYGEVLARQLEGTWTHRGEELVVAVSGDAQTTEAVFDVAGSALETGPNFVERYRRVAQAAQRPVPEIDPDDQPVGQSPGDQSVEAPTEDPVVDTTAADQPVDTTTDDQPVDTTTDDQPVDTTAADQPADTTTDDQLAGTATDESQPANAPAEQSTAGSTAGTPQTGVPDPTVLGEPTADPPARDQGSSAPSSPEPARSGSDAAPTGSDDPGRTERKPDGTAERQSQSEPPERERDQQTAGGVDEARSQSSDSDPEVASVAAEMAAKEGGGAGGSGARTIDDLREDATAFAATWPGYDLNYSAESLGRLDELVAEEYETDEATDDAYLTDRAAEAGGYFAEVVHRTLGGEWQAEPTPEIVVEGRVNRKRIDPVTLALSCFEGQASFAGTYTSVQKQLSLSVSDPDGA